MSHLAQILNFTQFVSQRLWYYVPLCPKIARQNELQHYICGEEGNESHLYGNLSL